MNNQGR